MIDCSLPLNILCNVIHFLMITACMFLIIDHSSFSNDIDDVGGLITRKDLDLCILHCVYRFLNFFYFWLRFIFRIRSHCSVASHYRVGWTVENPKTQRGQPQDPPAEDSVINSPFTYGQVRLTLKNLPG